MPDGLRGQQVQCPSCKAFLTADDDSSPGKAVVVVPVSSGGEKECPFCGEVVKASAKKCKHCGETIDVALRVAEEAKRAAEKQSSHPNVFMNAGGGGAAAASSSSGGGGGPSVTVNVSRPFNHGIHLLLTILTCGLWWPIWILLAILHK